MVICERVSLALSGASVLITIPISISMLGSRYAGVREKSMIALVISVIALAGLLAILIHAAFKSRRNSAA